MNKILWYCTIAVIFVTMLSCKLQNKIVLDGVGQGSMDLSFELPPYMLENINIIAASIPGGEELLKPESIARGLKASKDILQPVVTSEKEGSYNIRFRFANFAGNKQDIFFWSTEPNGDKRLSITINRKTYQELERRFPAMRDNPLLQLYGPATTNGMNQNDYLDMVEYSFGSDARRDIQQAKAVIYVQVPGKVISQTGGSMESNNTVVFRLSLLEFALLQREKHYRLVYR